MKTFAEVMESNPPRVVVKFQRGPLGQEQFAWGVVGTAPIFTTIGYISRVQLQLLDGCPNPSPGGYNPGELVIVYDGTKFSHYIDPEIPVESLVGMLENIKALMTASLLEHGARKQQANGRRSGIVGPDGQPMRF